MKYINYPPTSKLIKVSFFSLEMFSPKDFRELQDKLLLQL